MNCSLSDGFGAQTPLFSSQPVRRAGPHPQAVRMTASVRTTRPDLADVSDLELLNDEHRHAGCVICYPDPVGGPYIALCGRRAIGFDRPTAMTPMNVPNAAS